MFTPADWTATIEAELGGVQLFDLAVGLLREGGELVGPVEQELRTLVEDASLS